ncbi:hypothetical protein GCM10025776_16510 [Corallincola platygyrae]
MEFIRHKKKRAQLSLCPTIGLETSGFYGAFPADFRIKVVPIHILTNPLEVLASS